MSLASWPTIQGRRWRMASAIIRLPLAGKLVDSPQPWTPASVITRTKVQTFCGSSLYVAAPPVASTTYTSTSVIFMGRGSRLASPRRRSRVRAGRDQSVRSMEGEERLGDRALRGAKGLVRVAEDHDGDAAGDTAERDDSGRCPQARVPPDGGRDGAGPLEHVVHHRE